MKKILLGILLVFGFSFAGDFYGMIESIDAQNHTVKVNGTLFKVEPYTKIELDREWGWDSRLRFTDLKVGQFVKIDIIDGSYYNAQNGGLLIAEEIDVKESASRAY